MELKRLLLERLLSWARNGSSKPLLLQGPRQTGKSWLLRELGRQAFQYTAYFDFAARPELDAVFAGTRDPEVLIRDLAAFSKVPIQPGRTLLVFDEIQRSPAALGALRFFAEKAPQYAVAGAGCFLGAVTKHLDLSVPSRVQLEHVWPLSFEEFVLTFNPELWGRLKEKRTIEPVEDFLWPELERLFRIYMIVGGMPAAVAGFRAGQGTDEIDRTLDAILALYRADFSQYATPTEAARIAAVWDAIPSQLAKPNSRFFVSQIKKGARSREFAPAVNWLETAGLIVKVHQVSEPGMPLEASWNPDVFKLYMTDIGLLNRQAALTLARGGQKLQGRRNWKDVLAETFAAMSFMRQFGTAPCYWTSSNTAELAFLIAPFQDVVPVEVKARGSSRGRSLFIYRQKYSPSLNLRFSMKNLQLDTKEKVLSVPMPLADLTSHYVGLAYREMSESEEEDPLEALRKPLWSPEKQ
ncbi:MAG: hypothetical protein ACFWTZ_08190 [Burkholderia sp.]|jgi:uncharacterized protein